MLMSSPASKETCAMKTAKRRRSRCVHILSFRRQLFIQPEDIEKLPEHIQISFDNTDYWIYVSMDNITCFLCKEPGHLAKYCTAVKTHTEDTQTIESHSNEAVRTNLLSNNNIPAKEDKHASLEGSQDLNCTTTANSNHNAIDKNAFPIPGRLKRNRSEASLSSEATAVPSIITQDNTNSNSGKTSQKNKSLNKNQKKPKLTIPADLDLYLAAVDEHVSKTSGYPLNFEQYKLFLEQTFGNPKPIEVAKNFTEDTQALINILYRTYKYLTNRSIKNRITRIIRRLQQPSIIADSSTDDQNLEENIHL